MQVIANRGVEIRILVPRLATCIFGLVLYLLLLLFDSTLAISALSYKVVHGNNLKKINLPGGRYNVYTTQDGIDNVDPKLIYDFPTAMEGLSGEQYSAFVS